MLDCKRIPATRRERIVAAVEAGGKHLRAAFEAWIAADPFGGGVRVTITGPHRFEWTVTFPLAKDPAGITERVRETVED